MQNYFKSGVWNVICDVCGFEFKSDEVKKRWDGLMVCDGDFEHDHPQKYLRVRETGLAVPYVRAEPEDEFIDLCYVYAIPAFVGLAEVGCAKVGVSTPSYSFLSNLKNGSS